MIYSIGGACGLVLLIAIVTVTVCCWRRRKRRRGETYGGCLYILDVINRTSISDVYVCILCVCVCVCVCV